MPTEVKFNDKKTYYHLHFVDSSPQSYNYNLSYYTESFLGDYWMQLYLAKAKGEAPVNKFVIQTIN